MLGAVRRRAVPCDISCIVNVLTGHDAAGVRDDAEFQALLNYFRVAAYHCMQCECTFTTRVIVLEMLFSEFLCHFS